MNNHTLIYDGNELFGFGNNFYGQLGLGDNNDRNVPILIMTDKTIRKIVRGEYHTFILKESGEMFAFGYNAYGQLGLGDNNKQKCTNIIND